MKILAMDIGSGTKDILLFDDGKSLENCIKIVLPSPSSLYALRVKEATKLNKNLLVYGDIIGGGNFSSALLNHIKSGLSVFMSENAAYSIRNDLSQVKDLGIQLVKTNFFEKKFDGEVIRIDELNIKTLKKFFVNYNENFQDIDAIAIAVQDHGIPPVGISNRRFRIKIMKELLLENNDLFNLAFIDDKIPINFIRMRSAFRNSKEIIPNAKVIVTDTSFAAIQGCFCDPSVREDESILVINLGNDHTMASIIKNRRIYGIMEHHTKLLNAKRLERFIRKFINGKLADNEVFGDGGHGAFYTSPIKSRIEFITVTGPNRDMITETGLKHYFAVPGGDMMMTGPLGLVRVTKELNLRGKN